jgi:glycosyltransferase involved in cell wall biosynthesis
MRGLVFGVEPADVHRAGRTSRSLVAAGLCVDRPAALTAEALAGDLSAAREPVLIARAGVWLPQGRRIEAIPSSATGRPLIGVGAILDGPHVRHREAEKWTRHLARCGGDFRRRFLFSSSLPEPACVYLEAGAARDLAGLLGKGRTPGEALRRLIRERRYRCVHLGQLDGWHDPALRVLQLVTTIQIGGAERVTLDLAHELPRQGVRVCVAAFGRPTRMAFSEPEHFVDLSGVPNTPADRGEAVAELAREFGADLVHAHLIRAAEGREIKARGLPLVMTIHNLPPAWPAGLDRADDDHVDFLFACSCAVESAWRGHGESEIFPNQPAQPPVRTVWNGIDAKPFADSPERRSAAAEWRAANGWGAGDFVIAAVANPRPQKRLHILPEIVHRLRARIRGREVRLVFVGEHSECSAEAREAVEQIEAAIRRWDVERCVCWTGAIGDVATVLTASDVLVSPSAYEGLSLSHLEALAAGVPVVATAVGGSREVQSAHMHLVPPTATADEFAELLARLSETAATRESALPPDFTRHQMAARARRLYPRVIERASATADSGEVWLIANNFSTGGAQSSARRLLRGLADRGVKVRAFTVQESPPHPTPGRAALMRAGIPVVAVPPPETLDAADAVERILERAAIGRPRAVLFWNLIASYKILLADGFSATPVYDVSPGEMYFSSLAKYFAQPRPGLPYRTPRQYGSLLAGVVVKYAGESARASELGVPVHVIRNGITPGAPPPVRVGDGRRFIIGTAARISPDKKLEELIDAMRCALPSLRGCEVHIAGGVESGAEKYARELRLRARGLPVRWCGEVSDTAEFLGGLDLFAMISEPAGCPNASLEAMARGLPVVATDAGGACEQVIDGHTGRLVPRGDVRAFAEALTDLARDPAKRARLGAAAREHVCANFSLERMIDSYWRLCIGEMADAGSREFHRPPDQRSGAGRNGATISVQSL